MAPSGWWVDQHLMIMTVAWKFSHWDIGPQYVEATGTQRMPLLLAVNWASAQHFLYTMELNLELNIGIDCSL